MFWNFINSLLYVDITEMFPASIPCQQIIKLIYYMDIISYKLKADIMFTLWYKYHHIVQPYKTAVLIYLQYLKYSYDNMVSNISQALIIKLDDSLVLSNTKVYITLLLWISTKFAEFLPISDQFTEIF